MTTEQTTTPPYVLSDKTLADIRDRVADELDSWSDAAVLLAEVDRLRGILAGSVVEHAQQMSGGGWHLRYEDDWVREHYPLTEWIGHGQRFGGVIGKRTVIVVEDWKRVPKQRAPKPAEGSGDA